MATGGPWSVKGIDPRARARAKTAARREGMTLGEWLNRVILDDGPDMDDEPRWESHLGSYPGFTSGRDDENEALLRGMVERLTERIESTERQSTDFLNEFDRSISELAERVEETQMSNKSELDRTKEVTESIRRATEALAHRVQRIEAEGGASPDTIRAVESAFGKLAARVYRNENQSHQITEATQSALDEFGKATESATRSLQQRIEAIERRNEAAADDIRKAAERTRGTGQALFGLHNATDRLRHRIEEAERLTNDAASAFEESVSRLDSRLREVEARPNGSNSGEIEHRFDALSEELARVVADTRSQIARELQTLVSEPRVERLERALKATEDRLSKAESAHSQSLSRLGLEVTQLARAMDDRISESEKKAEAALQDDRAERALDKRFEALREEQNAAIARLSQNVSESENRAAEAIAQATQSMTEAVDRLETGQVKAKEDDLEARLLQSEERTAQRIEDAIAGISQRLEQARTETAETLSPVQRAMNALADRLEAIENRQLPQERNLAAAGQSPETDSEAEMASEAAASQSETLEAEPDFGTPLPPPPDAETPPGFDEDEVDDPFIIAEPPSPRAVAERQQEPHTTTEKFSSTHGPILQPMAPVDEPVTVRRPEPPQTQPARHRGPLGATADRDFLAAARDRARGDRSSSFDPYVDEAPSNGNGRAIMIAASVLGFIAIASAAGMLIYDSVQAPPASTAEALGPNLLDNLEGAGSTARSAVFEDTSQTDLVEAETHDLSNPTPVTGTPAQETEGSAALVEPETSTPAATHTAPPPEASPSGPVTMTAPTLQQAAAAGDPIARYQLGEERYNDGDFAGAAALLRRAAEQGIPAAQYRYAKLLERGEGIEANPAEARRWTRQAAQAGHRRAMHNLGVMYATGAGGERNDEEAARWFEEAALHGLSDSQFNLAVLFEQGRGRPQSPGDAYAWFSIAAQNGDAGAGTEAARLAPTLDPGLRAEADSIVASFTTRTLNTAANGQYDSHWGQSVQVQPEDIATTQRLLNALGYQAGPVDGQPGAQTQTAVRAFQTDNLLPVTGLIDDALIGRLENARSG